MKTNITKIGLLVFLISAFMLNLTNAQVYTIGGIGQTRSNVPATARQGFKNIAALRIDMVAVGTTTGVNTPLTFNGFSVAYNGTSISDITSAKIYFSTNTSANNADVFIDNGSISGNSISFGGNYVSTQRNNYYFWLLVDIAPGAPVSNQIQIVANAVTINGISYDITTNTFTGSTNIIANTPLTGEYTVNPLVSNTGRNFSSVSNLFTAINNNGIGDGGATFIFKDDQFFVVNNPGTNANFLTAQGATATRPVLFKRSGDGNSRPTIFASDDAGTEDALFGFTGASYITIDGMNFVTTAPGSAGTYSYGVHFRSTGQAACNNNAVINCNFDFSQRRNTESAGNNIPHAVYFNATGANSIFCVANNNIISNNSVAGFPRGLAVRGNAFQRSDNNIFANNKIFDVTVSGIRIENTINTYIYGNEIGNVTLTGNISGDNGYAGIRTASATGNTYIYNNKISNVSYLGTLSNYRVNGLSLGSGSVANSNITATGYVFNNIISNIQAPNVVATNLYTATYLAISDLGSFTAAFYKIFNNTFYNEANAPFFFIYSNGLHPNNAFELRNNIMMVNTAPGYVNTMPGVLYGTNFGTENSLSSLSSNNIYFSNFEIFRWVMKGNPTPNTVSGYNTFAQYRTSRPGEQTSQFTNLNFTDLNFYYLNGVNPGTATITGVPSTIPGLGLPSNLVNFDFNGYRRVASNPTIGANELITLVSAINISGGTQINNYRGSIQLNASILPANATYNDFTWSVANQDIATISGSGSLTALGGKDGVVRVIATAGDGSKITGLYDVTVTGQILISSISVSGSGGINTISVKGQTLQMNEVITPVNASNKAVTWSVNNPSIATISGTGVLTPVSDGIVQVMATSMDGSSVSGMALVTITNQIWVSSLSVSGQSGVNAISVLGGNLQMEVSYLPANASQKSVSWSVSPSNLASISGTGLLTALRNGTVTVTATSLDPGQVSTSIEVVLTNQFVPVEGITITGSGGLSSITSKGGTLQLEALIYPSNATNKNVQWAVSSGNANISVTGLLQAVVDGLVTVTATAADGSGITGNFVVTITNQVLVDAITITSSGNKNIIDAPQGTLQLTADVTPANASMKTLSWSTSDAAVANVNQAGLITAVADGIVTITAMSMDAASITSAFVVTVSNQIPVTSIVITATDGATEITEKGGTLQLQASILPANASNKNLNWSVSNASIATVNQSGLVTALADGVVTITAMSMDPSPITSVFVITITKQFPVSSITLNVSGGVTEITQKGGSLQLTATVLPVNASNGNIIWSVSDAGVASISGTGELIALTNGTVTVTATALDGSGVIGTIVITISGQEVAIGKGVLQGVSVFPNPSTNGTINIESTGNALVEIYSADGILLNTAAIQQGINKLSGLQAGFYLIKLSAKEGTQSFKVIIK